MNTFVTLLKREYWESKTSFVWVPLVITGITLFTAVLGLIIASTGSIETGEYGSHDLGSLFKLYDVSVDPDIKAFARCMTTGKTKVSCSGSQCRYQIRKQ